MNLIPITIVTVDKNYSGCINADDIEVLVRMPKYTVAEMHNGKTYKLYETIAEIQKRMNGSEVKETKSKAVKAKVTSFNETPEQTETFDPHDTVRKKRTRKTDK